MLCAVGPFAIEQGLVKAAGELTRVRIRNLNTGTFVTSDVQTPDGKVSYEGDTAIDGVPGSAAPVQLTFLDAAGSKTGKLFPTGSVQDWFDDIPVTCIDMAMPMMIIEARHLGKRGDETPTELDADKDFLQRLEALRLQAGMAMGLGDVSDKVIPKPVLVSKAVAGGTLQVRYFMPHNCHRALAITGSIGIATACVSEGSVVAQMLGNTGGPRLQQVRIEHPSGGIDVVLSYTGKNGKTIRASVVRTARRLFFRLCVCPGFPTVRRVVFSRSHRSFCIRKLGVVRLRVGHAFHNNKRVALCSPYSAWPWWLCSRS